MLIHRTKIVSFIQTALQQLTVSLAVHPSIHFCIIYTTYPLRVMGRGVGGEPIPADTGRQVGYTLDRSRLYHRATETKPFTLKFSPTVNLEPPIIQSLCLWTVGDSFRHFGDLTGVFIWWLPQLSFPFNVKNVSFFIFVFFTVRIYISLILIVL